MVRLDALRERLRLSLWFIPLLFAAAAVLAAFLLVALDRELSEEPSFTFGGTPEGARSVLSTIAQSMLTFTGLVFSVTMLVLQLASSQLSPRVMRTFLRDRGNQVVLGLFVATFLYTLLVLREVRGGSDEVDTFVPAVAVWSAFALLVASVAAFIWYIDHMAHAIRASTVIEAIWSESVAAVDRLYPDPFDPAADPDRRPEPEGPATDIRSEEAGVVVGVDTDRLLELAAEHDGVIVVAPRVGEFVPEGGRLATGWGAWDDDAKDEVRGAIGQANERTMEQDVGFGLRQLVDVAVRALSPGINDPTTAAQALDRIHDILRRLAGRAYPARVVEVDGRVRLVRPIDTFADHLSLALDEIRLSGRSQVQVVRRLDGLLEDLAATAPEARRPLVERHRRAVAEAAADRV
jgi:uncharacterized membrane protein